MSIIIISDLHGNQEGIQTLINNVFPKHDNVWCLGDLFFNYKKDEESKKNSQAVIDMLLEYKDIPVEYIRGNCDTDPEYKRFDSQYLKPLLVRKKIGNKELLLTHGHQYEKKNDLLELSEDESAPVIISGHTHIYGFTIENTCTLINPGAIGAPRNTQSISTYIELEPDTFHFLIRELNTQDILEELYL